MKTNELQTKIDQILWQDWDPIGVNSCETCRDEYSGYVSSIMALLQSGAELIYRHVDASLPLLGMQSYDKKSPVGSVVSGFQPDVVGVAVAVCPRRCRWVLLFQAFSLMLLALPLPFAQGVAVGFCCFRLSA